MKAFVDRKCLALLLGVMGFSEKRIEEETGDIGDDEMVQVSLGIQNDAYRFIPAPPMVVGPGGITREVRR